jgi:hypothetical protein
LLLAADTVTLTRPDLASAPKGPKKSQARLKVTADRVAGFKEAIALQVSGLPTGVSITGTTIAAGQNAVDLVFEADGRAKIGPAHLSIRGVAKTASGELTRTASLAMPRGQPAIDDVLLGVALPTPFIIKGEYDMGFAARGSVLKRKYKIVRNGYDGPIEVSLTDRQARHLQGVIGPSIVVPAGVDEFTYAAQLPPWMETGRTCRVCVMGTANIKDADGSVHRVSFSSVNQNEQLVAVVGPGKLAMELPKSSFIAKPREPIAVNVRLKRALGIAGPVSLELVLPGHIKGISAEPTIIAADRDEGVLTIRCADKLPASFNMPVTLRATLMHNGEPLTAEARLDVQR